MLDWKYIDGYVKKAIRHFLTARSESIDYIYNNFVTGSKKDYIAYFKDNKLTKWYWNTGIAKQAVFKVVISEKVLSMMESVVSEGTGKNAKVAGYRIGGKTGTSEDGVNTNKYVTSFLELV